MEEIKLLFSFEVTPGTTFVAMVGAALAPWIDLLYGADRLPVVLLLLAVIGVDWITGIAASQKDKTYSSDYGLRRGIPRTLFLMAFPVLANLFDTALGTPGLLFYAVAFGLIYHTWQSLTANAVRAGWEKYIPESVIKHIDSELQAKTERAAGRQMGGDPDADDRTGDEKVG